MRVFLYAAVRLFGESLGARLSEDERVNAVAVEHNALDLSHKVKSFGADVILFDVNPRRESSSVRALANELPGIPIVALAVPPLADEVIACADAGFVGYVPREASFSQLIAIMHMAVRGETMCDPKIARSLLEEIHRRRTPYVPDEYEEQLTRRETETLRLMSDGLSNKEIAAELSLSVATVKNHVHAILRKLRLNRRSQARQLLSEKPWLLYPRSG